MKVLIFIDHDILCRHFIMSGALKSIEESADVLFVFPDVDGKRFSLDPKYLGINSRYVRVNVPNERIQAWRWLLFADQLKWRPGKFEKVLRRFRWRTLGWRAALLLTVAAYPPGSNVLKKLVARKLADNPISSLVDLITKEKPDIVLHPSVLDGTFINDICDICKSLKIPTIVAMNSWDNPSTKRTVVSPPDWLLVWGEQTKEHAVRFVGMLPERVIPFGAAQFDIFLQPPRMKRSDFQKKLGIPSDSKIILYAGSNAKTDELNALLMLDKAIEDKLFQRVAIIYRPHPWGGGGRDGRRLANVTFKHVIIDPNMQSYINALATGDPGITLPNYQDTHELLSAVDLVISPMSTILIEAVLHKKPVIVHVPLSNDPLIPLGPELPLLHFEEFLKLDDVRQTRTEAELVAEIKMLLVPDEINKRGKNLFNSSRRFLNYFEEPWSKRILDFINIVVHKK